MKVVVRERWERKEGMIRGMERYGEKEGERKGEVVKNWGRG